MVGLVNTGDRIQIEVNLEAAQSAGIRISSRVLNLAEIVRPAQKGGN
jgi:predicted transcriptional regulator